MLIIGSAARAQVLQHDLVQRTMGQLNDHNNEDVDGLFTRPTLDLYFVNKYWNFLTSSPEITKEEIADLEKARTTLQHYEKIYSLMEYGSDLNGLLTCLDTRVSNMNPSVFLTIYRQSAHNSAEKIFAEVELCLEAYYGMIEDCKDHPEWIRKIEEEIG